MNEQAMKFRIGVFVLAALLLLAVLITLFGSFPRVLTRGTEYTVRFTHAPGVGPGTPVRRSGVRVGEIERVDLDDETGEVRVVILIQRPYSIRKNEVPTLTHGLLGGDIAVDFLPRRDPGAPPDRSPIDPGSELTGALQPSFTALLNQAQDVLPTTQEALNDIRKSVQRFEKLAPAMEEAIKEYRELGKATREMVPELTKTNNEVREFVKAGREMAPEVKKAATAVGELAQVVRDVVPDVKKTNDEVRELVKAVRETVPALKATNDEVGKAAGRLGDLAKATQDSIPDLKKTNTEIQATLITWQKVGERVKLLVETNEKRLEETLEHLNKTLQGASKALSEENNANLSLILRNVRDGTQNLKTLSQDTTEFVREGQKTMRRVGDSVGKADEVLGNLQQATRPLAERGANVVKNLDEGTTRLNDILADVQALLRAVDKSDGTLKRFLTDPSLYQRLEEILCTVARVMPRVDRVLRDVEVFADKIARHPESLGVGGVVRPSAGLKESPSAPVPWRPGSH